MAKFEVQIATAHPVFFLGDSATRSVPPDTGAAFVTTTDDCLCFWVMSDVDGTTLVTITEEACRVGSNKLFSGSLNAPSGIITLMDSSAFQYVNIPVPLGPVRVDIWADNDLNPEWVWIQLEAIRQF